MGFSKDSITYEDNQDQIMDSIKKRFSPEFLNSIDNFIFFNRLKKEELVKVVKMEMNHLPVKKTRPLINYIINKSNHYEYGARNVAKFIKNNVATLVADAILRKQIPTNGTKYYTLKVTNDDLTISNIEEDSDGWKNQKTSESS